MFLKRLCFIVFSCLVLSANTLAKDGNNQSFGMRLYSNMYYHEEAGDFLGLQIELIPNSQDMQVLWRQAEGSINSSLLLEVKQSDKNIKVVMPKDYTNEGEWTLTQSKDGKILHMLGPKNAHFDLKEVSFK